MGDFTQPSVSDDDIRWVTDLMGLPDRAFAGADGLDPRLEALKASRTMDVEACPGSGKTTLLVAKLGILSRGWKSSSRGICVLSHTNVARLEIESGLGGSAEGQRIMVYPHHVGTIHSFINEFLALPWLRSLGYTVKAIDDDICLARRWSRLPLATRKGLEKTKQDQNILRIRKVDYSVGDVRWGSGKLGAETDTYRAIQAACKEVSEEGFFCYDEMFVWAADLLEQYPQLLEALRWRFPVLFIDEVQDNSETQSALLHRIFMDGESGVVRQRFGDINQAIFGYTGQTGAATDPFPAKPVVWPIPNSHRFGQQIADLANPFAVAPQDLKGNGPPTAKISTDTSGRHTVFLFDDSTRQRVLYAYAQYLADTFSDQELIDGIFTAVGAVHTAGGTAEKPRVGQYWPHYDHELTSSEPKPRTFFQYVAAARKVIKETGEAHHAVQRIAEAVLRLARVVDPAGSPSSKRRVHLQLLELLDQHTEAKASYLELQKLLVFGSDVPSKQVWATEGVPRLQIIVTALVGSASLATAADFLMWPQDQFQSDGTPAPVRDNVFRHPVGDPIVNIRVGSIHSVKGETHTATLVLDTFWKKNNFASLKPWLLGQKSGGDNQGPDNLARLRLHYVAMTRPTHLVCLAMKEDILSEQEIAILRHRGWRVARVKFDGMEWI